MTTPRTAAAAALLEARRDAGLTLRELESRTCVDHTHLSKMEHDHDRPDPVTLATVLRACGWPDERIAAVVMAERIGRVPDDVRALIESEAATAALESRIEAVADLIHETCVAEWERRAARDPGRALTLHGPDAHVGSARVVLGLEVGT